MTHAAVSAEAHPFKGERPVTGEVVREHNLTEAEYGDITAMLGRTPTLTELGIFSALWSEHCSYKHTKPVLRKFPTEGPQVVQGPGENAGVLRLPDGWAVAFKIESHNHPSAVARTSATSSRWPSSFTSSSKPRAVIWVTRSRLAWPSRPAMRSRARGRTATTAGKASIKCRCPF